jgi:hypothetical protein
VNYLKCLTSDDCRTLMDAALRAKRECDGGKYEDEDGSDHALPLAKAASNVLEALR